jgi:transmembrane sensor
MQTNNKNNKINQATMIRMVKKYLAGKGTAEEQQFLETYYSHFENKDDVLDELSPDEMLSLENKMERAILSIVHKRRNNLRYLQIAASLLIGLSIITGIFLKSTDKIPAQYAVVKKSIYRNDINPGREKAILILANGQKISLDDVKVGKSYKQGSSIVNKLTNGKLVYNAMAVSPYSSTVSYNTIQTPIGGEYQVVLPDGSKVWLNSHSTLYFPTAFQGKERIVKLTGEGYFEVAKNSQMPFKVQVNNTEVKVLGTHFNIMAYTDEPFIRTTLLEGSVTVSKGPVQKTLVPGQQAMVDNNGAIAVNYANMDTAVTWKNGYFNFDRDDIQTVMRRLARWYDMDVEFEGKMSNDEFSGKIRRNVKASKALQFLELTNLHFKVEGKKVTVIQ